jgi:hypothetical protein
MSCCGSGIQEWAHGYMGSSEVTPSGETVLGTDARLCSSVEESLGQGLFGGETPTLISFSLWNWGQTDSTSQQWFL